MLNVTTLALVLGTALSTPPSATVRGAAVHARPPVVAQTWHLHRHVMVQRHPLAPPPRLEVVQPRRGLVWVEGGFTWRDGRYVSLPGHWERERRGYRWQIGRWEPETDHYVWMPGAWVEVAPGPSQVAAPPAPVIVQPPPLPPSPLPVPPPPAPRYARISISGQVFDQYGRPLPGVMVVLAGTSEGRAITDQYGHYVFAGLIPGSYAVRPNDPRCGFGPDVMNLNGLSASTVQNFNATCR